MSSIPVDGEDVPIFPLRRDLSEQEFLRISRIYGLKVKIIIFENILKIKF